MFLSRMVVRHETNAGLLGTFSVLYFEADALGEGQLCAVVNRIRRAAHIRFPGIGTRLPPASGVLLSTERPANFSPGSSDIDVGNPAIGTRWREEPLRLARIVGEYCRAEALPH